MPDSATDAFIDALDHGPAFPASIINPGLNMVAGDSIMVCDSTHCATYVLSDDDLYQGIKIEERTNGSGSADGGGGAETGENGGGYNPGAGGGGGGGGSSGGGKVTIGDPVVVEN
ncbi:hypothetical protein [Lysobacter silvisoli]|nr:hypothetical protein [Lysobacter silvisoli]